jgi:hypothetical protein
MGKRFEKVGLVLKKEYSFRDGERDRESLPHCFVLLWAYGVGTFGERKRLE